MRQAEEIVFCFDGDDAGRRAAWRALENALPQLQDGKQVRFLFLPDGEDPDTYVRKNGKAEFETRLADAGPLSRFLLEELASRVNLSTAEGRANLVHAAKPLLKQMQAGALRLQLVRELAGTSRLSADEVAQLCEIASVSPRPPSAPARNPRPPVVPLAERLLRVLVSNPDCAAELSAEQRALLDSPELAPVAELIDALKDGGITTPAMLFEATRDSRYAALYQSIAGEMLAGSVAGETAKEDLAGAFTTLEREHVESEYQRLTATGVRDEYYQEIARRLAKLKGAPQVENRPQA